MSTQCPRGPAPSTGPSYLSRPPRVLVRSQETRGSSPNPPRPHPLLPLSTDHRVLLLSNPPLSTAFGALPCPGHLSWGPGHSSTRVSSPAPAPTCTHPLTCFPPATQPRLLRNMEPWSPHLDLTGHSHIPAPLRKTDACQPHSCLGSVHTGRPGDSCAGLAAWVSPLRIAEPILSWGSDPRTVPRSTCPTSLPREVPTLPLPRYCGVDRAARLPSQARGMDM